MNSKVRMYTPSGSASAIETAINAIITAEEANGFVLEGAPMLIGDSLLLTFKALSVLPGGGGVKKAVLEFDYQDLSAASLTKTVAIPNVPANITPLTATVEVTTPFVGAGISALTAEVGDTADPNGLQTAQDLLTSGVKGVAGAAYVQDVLNNLAAEALFTATGANLDQLTAGEGKITIHYIEE